MKSRIRTTTDIRTNAASSTFLLPLFSKEIKKIANSFGNIDCALVNLSLYKGTSTSGAFSYSEKEIQKLQRTMEFYANDFDVADDEGASLDNWTQDVWDAAKEKYNVNLRKLYTYSKRVDEMPGATVARGQDLHPPEENYFSFGIIRKHYVGEHST